MAGTSAFQSIAISPLADFTPSPTKHPRAGVGVLGEVLRKVDGKVLGRVLRKVLVVFLSR